jgi:hypothetical protein
LKAKPGGQATQDDVPLQDVSDTHDVPERTKPAKHVSHCVELPYTHWAHGLLQFFTQVVPLSLYPKLHFEHVALSLHFLHPIGQGLQVVTLVSLSTVENVPSVQL